MYVAFKRTHSESKNLAGKTRQTERHAAQRQHARHEKRGERREQRASAADSGGGSALASMSATPVWTP